MKSKVYLILLLSLLSCLTTYGQSFAKQFRIAERERVKYGETDTRYLDALGDAIGAACEEEKFEEANRLRLIHIDIVKGKYGENSIKYAEDLWWLGNESEFMGEAYTIDCYRRAAKIYEDNDAQSEYPYCDIMFNLARHYYEIEEWDTAILYLDKYVLLYAPWSGKEWKGNFLPIVDLVNGYVLLGNLYQYDVGNLYLANEAYIKSIDIMDEYRLFDEYESVGVPYLGLSLSYFDLDDYDKAEKWHLRYLNVVERLFGCTSEDYLTGLAHLQRIYYATEDLDSIKEVFNELLPLIEQRDEERGIVPQADSSYIRTWEELVAYCASFLDYQGIMEYVPELLRVYEESGRAVSSEYHSALYLLITACHTTGHFLKEYSLYCEFEELSEKLDLKATDDYWSYLSLKADALVSHKKWKDYEETIKELKYLTTQLYGATSSETYSVVVQIAEYNTVRERYEDAIHTIEQCYQILNSGEMGFETPEDSLYTMAGLHNMEGMIYTYSDLNLAGEKFLLAIKEKEVAGINDISEILCNIGCLYYNQKNDVKQACKYYERALQNLEDSGKDGSTEDLTILLNLASCYQDMGMNSKAITIYDRASRMVESQFGKFDPDYGRIEQYKAAFYSDINDYSAAKQCCKNAMGCYESVYGKESVSYAACLNTLANIYRGIDDFLSAEETLLQAIKILESLHSPLVVFAYMNLWVTYLEAGEGGYDKGLELIRKAEPMLIENGWENTDNVAIFYSVLGYEMLKNNNSDGMALINRALDVFEGAGEELSLDYYECLMDFGQGSFYNNSQSEELIPRLLGLYKSMYLNDIVFLNGKERESLMSGEDSYRTKNILFSSRETDKYDDLLYDFLLFNKGLLLSTSVSYARAVYNSGDAELIEKYRVLQNFNKFLSGEDVELDMDYSFEEAKDNATTLEREITLWLRQNKGYTDELDYSFDDVRDALVEGELAVEFVSYDDFIDSTEYYAALLAKKEWSKPKYVWLCKKDDLDKLVGQSPDKLYGETFVSQTAYDLIWTPLEPYLGSVRTVYFSPAGHINRMAVGHLYNGEKYFGETYNVVRLTSTREICNKYLPKDYSSAVLYGGLTYDEDDETLIAESRSVTGDVSGFRERFRGFTDGATRKGWNYLPGTLEEVNRISSVLADATINYDLYSSEKGNEESFKALSGTEFNILHIATHGFYMTESEAERSDFFSSYAMPRPSFGSFGTSSIDVQTLTMSFTPSPFSAGISPLQRSGLILSGGNRVWTGQTIPDGVEDGILTAAEVANLDFAWCDVVVLSACETGLGEITDEGVFGLQRAFKNAGVNTIVMSLWEVDDAATSLMMQTFYKNLVSGKSKRESFLTAQEKVREQYPDPRYWAAFIMLD